MPSDRPQFAIQHIGTRHFLIFRPSLNLGVDATFEPNRAQHYDSMSEGVLEQLQLREFAGAYSVVPVTVDA